MESDIKKELQDIKKELKEIRKILAERSIPGSWVSAHRINQVTGWNKERLRQAREQGTVKCKPSGTGCYVYLLESIPETLVQRNNP